MALCRVKATLMIKKTRKSQEALDLEMQAPGLKNQATLKFLYYERVLRVKR